jgi:agmatine deiminase
VTTPRDEHFFQPAEWARHSACWLAWPSAADLWLENLEPARTAFIELARGIARSERVELLVPTAEDEATARAALAGAEVRCHRVPFGDIWLRDTAPIFVTSPGGAGGSQPLPAVAAVRFGFNGWGGKYVLDHDAEVSARIAAASGLRTFVAPLVLEGGSVDVDGEGTCLTTRQCLLNPNRNPGKSQADIEEALADMLGTPHVLWLDEGLANDHTDGHIDNIARFVAPGVVVCMAPSGGDDPNREVLERIATQLAGMTDARGRKLQVVRVPGPGRVEDDDGKVVPASHVNFYLSNDGVFVPTYGTASAGEAVAALGRLFPTRRAQGIDARAILSGGGAFHCISQQVPEVVTKRAT